MFRNSSGNNGAHEVERVLEWGHVDGGNSNQDNMLATGKKVFLKMEDMCNSGRSWEGATILICWEILLFLVCGALGGFF